MISDPTLGSSEPGRYWTTTNVGEAAPDVLSPMCTSLWGRTCERAWLYSLQAYGVLPTSMQPSPDTNDWGAAIFYGRVAMNLDVLRTLLSGLPGFNADDFERDLLGSVRPDAPPVQGNPKRLPVIAAKAPITLLRQGKRVRAGYAATRTWWADEVFTPTGRPIERLVTARERFCRSLGEHCVWRFVFAGVQSAITDAAAKVGDPVLGTRLLSGVGDVLETRMADDIWRLAHGELTEDAFLREWGYHGPNEGNADARVWREDPTPVRGLAKTSLSRPDLPRPREREQRASRQRGEAAQAFLAALPAVRRPVFRALINRVPGVVQTVQIGKATYLMCIDAMRRAARDFGAEQVAGGVFREVDDVFYLTVEECQALAAGRLPDAAAMVTARRGYRLTHRQITLPVYFHGMPEPLPATTNAPEGPVELTGAASGGGRIVGRARVLLDVNDAIDLDPGDILVCRFTDPSWAPLMSLAEALVIDIGGAASHGAVVARELGIPFVIGTERGTTALRDGDRILVDGEQNLVRVVA